MTDELKPVTTSIPTASEIKPPENLKYVEKLMVALWKDVLGVEIPRPFPRLSYTEAMAKYGSDKPDLRFELPLCDLTDVVVRHDGGGVGLLQSAVKSPGGVVKGWRLPAAQAKSLSRADLDKLEEFAKGFGARGLGPRCRLDAVLTRPAGLIRHDADRRDRRCRREVDIDRSMRRRRRGLRRKRGPGWLVGLVVAP